MQVHVQRHGPARDDGPSLRRARCRNTGLDFPRPTHSSPLPPLTARTEHTPKARRADARVELSSRAPPHSTDAPLTPTLRLAVPSCLVPCPRAAGALDHDPDAGHLHADARPCPLPLHPRWPRTHSQAPLPSRLSSSCGKAFLQEGRHRAPHRARSMRRRPFERTLTSVLNPPWLVRDTGEKQAQQ